MLINCTLLIGMADDAGNISTRKRRNLFMKTASAVIKQKKQTEMKNIEECHLTYR